MVRSHVVQNHQVVVLQLPWMHVGPEARASASASVSAVEPQGATEARAEVESGRVETAAEAKGPNGPAALTHPFQTPRSPFLHLPQAIPWLIARGRSVVGSKPHCASPPP